MRHRLVPFVTLASILSFAAPLAAQLSTASASDLAAFTAIILTPAGALPQLVRVRRTMDSTSRGEAAVRYGRYNFRNQSGAFSNIGGTAMLHFAGRVQLGGTVGYRSCPGCEGLKMGSVDLGLSLFRREASGEIGGDTDIGMQVSAGMGKAAGTSDVSARSLTVSVPLAVSLPQAENSLLTLFLAPSLAYGSLKENGTTDGGSRFIVGAGLGYAFAFGLGVHASAHRIIIEDSPTQYGFALSWVFGGK
jgi:hypothetical protein